MLLGFGPTNGVSAARGGVYQDRQTADEQRQRAAGGYRIDFRGTDHPPTRVGTQGTAGDISDVVEYPTSLPAELKKKSSPEFIGVVFPMDW